MKRKSFFPLFLILLIPMILVGALIDLVIDMQMRHQGSLNWLVVAGIGVGLAGLFAWRETRRGKKDGTPTDPTHRG